MKSKIELIQKYLSLLETFSDSQTSFDEILHPEFQQREYPNVLNKNGQLSDLADVVRRASAGKKMLSRQTYQILNSIEDGEQIALEVQWIGTMAIDAGSFKSNQVLKANFCFICEFKDGKIHRQRNYDCFEPFA